MSQFLSGNTAAAAPNWEWECHKSEEPDNGALNSNMWLSTGEELHTYQIGGKMFFFFLYIYFFLFLVKVV